MTITFFGHRDTPSRVKKPLRKIIKMLIEDYGADLFYVGNQGEFDNAARIILKDLKKEYKFSYGVVLAYSPFKSREYDESLADAIFPEELENASAKSAIPRRNEWLINNSDMVITYVHKSEGGAYRSKILAEKKGKIIINIPELK